jgi:L-seryl-tRNA(Ser) seleniumtransferase
MLDMDDYFALWDPPPELIDKAKFPGLPRHGIGRALKVSKEQIMALLTALKLFTSGAYDAELAQKRGWLEQIGTALDSCAARCRLIEATNSESMPSLEITIDEQMLGRTAFDVCRRLRQGTPPVYVGHWGLPQAQLIINPLHLNDERTAILARRLSEELRSDQRQ